MSVPLDDALAKELEALAKASGKSIGELTAEALRRLVRRQQYLRAVDEGLEDAKAGHVSNDGELEDLLEDWSRSP